MVDWLEQFLSLMPTQNELFKINTVPVSSYWLMLFEDFNIFYSSCWKWPPWPSVPTKKDCSKEKITELVQIYYPNWEQNSGQDPDPNTMYLWSPTLEFQQYTFFSYYQCCGAGPTLTGSGSRSRPTPAPGKKICSTNLKKKIQFWKIKEDNCTFLKV